MFTVTSGVNQEYIHLPYCITIKQHLISMVGLVFVCLRFVILSRVHIRPRLWSKDNPIKYEMGSHQLITVPDYNWITTTSKNSLGAWLNKMTDTWWFEETTSSLHKAIKRVKHHAQQETRMVHVWYKISQGMADSTREVHNLVVLKLTTSSKNIARFETATKCMETNDKNGSCLN